MDLGEIGVILVAEGEAEASAAVERFVRARDAAVRSMEEAAQREIRAAEAVERAIQRELREYENLVSTAAGLQRAYQDLAASFNPLNRAQLEYSRNIEMLDAALEANIINEQQRARVMEELANKMSNTVESQRAKDFEAQTRALTENTRAIQAAQIAYDELRASLDPIEAANQKYQRGIDVLNQAEMKHIITVDERIMAEKRLEAQLAKDITSARAAQTREETQALERSKQAHAALVGEVERLRAQVSPAIKAQQMYDQAIKTTTRAVERQILTQDAANDIMNDVRAKMESMGHIVNQNGEVMSRADTQWQRWARGGVQNAGYQVADFAVQIQGGTSALVAFGQQAPQFLGMFGAIGSTIGAVVAIAAAVANVFYLTSESAGTLKDSIQSLDQAARDYISSMNVLDDDNLSEKFGDLEKKVRDVTRATLELDKAAALAKLSESIRKIRSEFVDTSMVQNALAGVTAGMSRGLRPMEVIKENMRQENFGELGLAIGYDVFQGYIDGLTERANSGDVEGVAQMLSDMIGKATEGNALLGEDGTQKPGAALLLQLRQIFMASAEITAELNGSADAAEDLKTQAQEIAQETIRTLEALKEAEAIRQKELKSGEDMLVAVQNEAAIQEAIVRYGQDSLGVETLRAEQAREAFYAKVDALDIEEGLKQILRDNYDEMVGATNAANDFAAEAARAKSEFEQIVGLVSAIQGQIANIGLSNVGKQARLAALQAGQSESDAALAAAIATERARLAPALGAAEPIIRAGAQTELDSFIAAKTEEAKLEAEIKKITDDRREAEKDSKGSKSKDKDPIAELLERARIEKEIYGLSESERDIRVAVARGEKKYTEDYIQQAAAVLEADRKIVEQRDEMKRLGDFIGNQLEDSLMSIVDGTKSVGDAFKDMSRAIIAELYRVIVVQQIVGQFQAGGGGILGAAFSAFGSAVGGARAPVKVNAMGNVFYGGSVVPYADGGVVDGPTTFPMSGGNTGLMGEAGPEGILPLKRGSNGRLGVSAEGVGGVTVNNNISVNGSDPETVRREITKMIPQLSKMTTAAVMDARKRGGAMKSTFG